MKKSMSKNAILSIGFVCSIFAITMASIGFADAGVQGANVISSTSKSIPVTTKTPIRGEYLVSTTISENFLKKGSDKIQRKIFINNKGYEIDSTNQAFIDEDGTYLIEGSLDATTKKVSITSAKILTKTEQITEKSSSKLPTKKVAVFLVDYQDTATQPFYPSDINQMMFGNGKFANFYKEASYNRQTITGDVFGWFTIPENVGNNACQANLETNLAPLITNQQINLADYTNFVIITLCPGFVANGSSNTSAQPHNINGIIYNKPATWVNISATKWNTLSDQMSESQEGPHTLTNLEHILIHEFGHALGLHHAHGISCSGNLPNANCQNIGLGNYFDVMSYNTIGLHFSAWAKAKLGWLNNSEVFTITSPGIYTISPIETPSTPTITGAIKTYKIKPSNSSSKTPIWIEYRKATGFDTGISTPALGGMGENDPPYNISENQNGIFVYKEGFENMYSGQINPKTARLMYLRGAPNLGTNANPYQVSLGQGQTYSEPRYGLSITTLAPTSPNTQRFQVSMNSNFACTRLAPQLSASVFGSNNIAPNQGTSIKVSMKNMDYLSCPNSNFLYSFNFGGLIQNGNSSTLTSFLSNLSPDDERSFGLGVWVPNNTQAGTYNVSVTITNQSSGLSSTVTIPITVQ